MTPGFSLHLDALRAAAAIIVVLSHWAYPRFTDGQYLWIRELNLGSDAVVIFFVLSGFVIAFCAHQKDRSIGAFGFARLTRLMSVALPALLLGYVLDRTGSTTFDSFYEGRYFNPIGLPEQLLRGLSFSNEWGGMEVRLGSNGPYWSLSYEAAYYLLFAVFFYIQGAGKWLLLATLLFLFGINIVLLLPCWAMGVWLYHACKDPKPIARRTALYLAIGPVLLYAFALARGLPGMMQMDLWAYNLGHNLRFSNEFTWNWLIAVLTTAHLYGVYHLTKDRLTVQSRFAPVVRYLAAGSFSIYLVHYPVLQFLKPALFADRTGFGSDAALLLMTLAICLAFAAVFERTLRRQRAAIDLLFRRPSPSQ